MAYIRTGELGSSTTEVLLDSVLTILTDIRESDFQKVYTPRKGPDAKFLAFVPVFHAAVYLIEGRLTELKKSNAIKIATKAIHDTAQCLDTIAGPTGGPSPLVTTSFTNLNNVLAFRATDSSPHPFAKFIYDCLSIRSSGTRRKFLKLLENCEAHLKIIVGATRLEEKPIAPSTETIEEVEEACRNVNNLYEALLACNCDKKRLQECLEMRLHLATKLEYKGPETQHSLDIFMTDTKFQCLHEVHFEFPKARSSRPRVRFRVEGHPDSVDQSLCRERDEITCLCNAEYVNPDPSFFRSNLALQGNRLWQLQPTPREFFSTPLKDQISLTELLQSSSSGWTLMARLVLAVILADSLLYLHDGPWLHGHWKRSKIVFYSNGGSIPVRPFLRSPVSKSTFESNNESFFHRYPGILEFGVALLEIYLGKRIDEDQTPAKSRWAIASRVWDQEQFNMNPDYRSVVKACLVPDFGAGRDCTPDRFRKLIFNRIVNPLKKELATFTRGISEVRSLDEVSKKINLLTGHFRHVTQTQECPFPDTNSARDQTLQLTRFEGGNIAPLSHKEEIVECSGKMPTITTRFSVVTGTQLTDDKAGTFDLFEDENQDQDLPKSVWQKTDTWTRNFRKLVRSKLNEDYIDNNRIKVAILDSGIDMNNTDIDAASDRIKSVRSWVDGKNGLEDKSGGDTSGHGTHIAGIILDLAPNADLYIARITKTRKLDDVSQIVNALEYATKEWNVDMITMSFGFQEPIPSIKKMIQKAIHENKIVFAAASNDGGNSPRAFPAWQQGVICVHSADADGNKSLYNPSPKHDRDNFSILGQYIQSCWLSTNDAGASKRMTGTSFATPVAVALACFIVGYVQQEIQEPGIVQDIMGSEGMTAVFRKLAEFNTWRDGYHWITPFAFFKLNRTKICEDIKHALRTG